MAFRFRARLRGNDAHGPGYIEVPRFIMRSLPWGRCVRVVVTLDDKHRIPTTVMNVGWGPSFLIPRHARIATGIPLDAPVTVEIARR
ncbi:MAG TPA: hypothetical protein VFN49_04945 [Candidatus Aquilonibacter sp.]|nr:hypothetical protein [Candidatus Aquilonibacter sp.]